MRRARSAALSTLLAGLALVACGVEEPKARAPFPEGISQDTKVCPPANPAIPGIDVSSYQGSTINWGEVADAGVKFAIAKATEGLTGSTLDDPDFKTNWQGMKSAGIVRGAYHFFHPQDDGAAQADAYLAQVGTLGEAGDLPPLLDWEVTDNQSNATNIARAQAFIDEIKLKTGLDTIVYTYPSYWQSLGSPAQFAQHPLWLANYTGATTSCPTLIAPWTNLLIWQWSDGTGLTAIPGVSGGDRNLFNGTLDELRAWATPPIAQASGNSALTAVNWPDKHVEIFGRSPAGALLHVATGGTGDSWSTTNSLGAGVACGSAAAFAGPPGLYPEVFSPLPDGGSAEALWSGGSWDALASFGGAGLSDFSTVVGMDGRARVFALGADHALWTNRWTSAGTAWVGWSSLGGAFVTGSSNITWGNGTIELFATDSSGTLWHRWTDSSTASGWSPWTSLGAGIASRPAAVRWADGTVGHAEVFARGADNLLHHAEYSLTSGWPAATGALSAGVSIIGEPSALMNPPGSAQSGPEVFARDATGRVVHLARSGQTYGSFAPLGNQIAASDPFGWIRGDGTAEVFAVDLAGDLVRARRDASGTWGAWSAIGAGFDPCAPALPGDGGVDGGSDGGGDGGVDAGPGDAGFDGGMDAGFDAGTDAGFDAGLDGGADAGSDGGTQPQTTSSGCSGGGAGPLGMALAGGLLLFRRRRKGV